MTTFAHTHKKLTFVQRRRCGHKNVRTLVNRVKRHMGHLEVTDLLQGNNCVLAHLIIEGFSQGLLTASEKENV